jgi:glycosyltransferase involved in cell wall biosynthesis
LVGGAGVVCDRNAPSGCKPGAASLAREAVRGVPRMSGDDLPQRREALEAAGMPSPVRPVFAPIPDLAPSARPRAADPLPNCLALIATRNELCFAQVTARSFLAHHPGFPVFLLLVDGAPEDAAMFPEGRILCLQDIALSHAGWYAAKFTAAEFCKALKPAFLRHLAALADSAIYLDCNVAVFSRLTELIDLLATADLVLLPHMLSPSPRPEQFQVHPARADLFKAGLIDAGSFGIRLANCAAFLAFWQEANFAPGTFHEPAGYLTDQHYLTWALVSVPAVHVLRDDRYNVGYWNLHERDFRLAPGDDAGVAFLVGDRPLGTFHFSGYDIDDRLRLSRHDQHLSIYDLPAVTEIIDWYSDRVLDTATAALRDEAYRFDRIANGLVMTPFLRDVLKKYEIHAPRFDTRTRYGADCLCAFLMDPLPAAASMLPLVAAEIYDRRPDLQVSYPGARTAIAASPFWHWFCRYAGAEYDIQFLVDRFRRSLTSAPLQVFAEQVSAALGNPAIQFLGPDRVAACQALRAAGRHDLADTLLEARAEVHFFTELSAAFAIYNLRGDLRAAFPDILDRDHLGFAAWLEQNAAREHGCSEQVAVAFRRHAVATSLGRIFSYLSRREDMTAAFQDSLLSEDPEPAMRDIMRDSGEGLEHSLEDAVLLRYVHQTSRRLLVALYLELPLRRQLAQSSRLAETSIAMLPAALRDEPWATRGCAAHATWFDPFEALLDDEMRRWAETHLASSRNVLGVLRRQTREVGAIATVEPRYRAAIARLPRTIAVQGELPALLKQRTDCPGVNIFGYFKSDIGVGESARGLASAVALLRPVNRVPLYTAQVQDDVAMAELFQRYDYLTDTNVFVSYPHQRDDYLGMLRPEQLAGRRNIVHLAWEQKGANPWWQAVYDRYDEIWMISAFAATPFREMFPDRVRVVPNVLDFDNFPPCEAEDAARLKQERLRFLFAFDTRSSMERKNPEAVVEAYIKAFKGTRHARRVSLTLKVDGMRWTRHAARIDRMMLRTIEAGLAVQLDDRHLPRDGMLALIAGADCYVSLHHAEGFGYTMAEAMAYGVPVVASGYSGNLEYMTTDNSYLVPCTETLVRNPDGPFQRGSFWGEPDTDAAAQMLRAVADNPAHARAVGERGRLAVRSQLSAQAVAETIRSSFSSAREPTGEATAAQ